MCIRQNGDLGFAMKLTATAIKTGPYPATDKANRYAIYFAPRPESGWWRFGSAWLGRDALTGATGAIHPPALPDDLRDVDLAAMVDVPRHYGFHATLKPPFRLIPGRTAADVYFQAATLAATLSPLRITPLLLAEVGSFVGLRAPESDPALMTLAAQCMVAFDNLRAPPDAAERLRRRQAGLSARQSALLDQWGYPYVFEEFQFHLTLTNRLSPEIRARIIKALQPQIDELNKEPLLMDALAIFEQRGDAPFRLKRRYGFNGAIEIYDDG